MLLTLDWMEKTFALHNAKYYNGKLKVPTFEITHKKSVLGSFHRSSWKISMTDYYDRDERGFAQILLHEMVHLYVYQHKIGDYLTKHHGFAFYAEAERLNAYGWNITRCTPVAGLRPIRSQGKTYRIIAYEMANGRYFTIRINPNREQYFRSCICNSPCYFKSAVIVDSYDSATFDSYPQCTTRFRGGYCNADDFEQFKSLEGAEMLKVG